MTKLASLFLTAALSLASGVALAAETNVQSNNGRTNSSAGAGQAAPDACENIAPNNVDNSNMSSGGIMLHPSGSSMNREGVIRDEMHRNTMCKDGRCPDVNKKVRTGNSINNDAEIKTNGTTQ